MNQDFEQAKMIGRMRHLIDAMPGFNMPKILGLDDPKLKRLLDALEGKHKMFWLKDSLAPFMAMFDKAKAFFMGNKKVDLGGTHGVAETETRDKGKIGIVALQEYARNIQTSVSPREARMEKLAKDSNQQLREIAKNTAKLGDRSAMPRYAA